MMRAVAIARIAAVLVIGSASADEPLAPPSEVTATSPSGAIRAVSDPKTGTRVEDMKQNKVLWRLSSWHRSMRVADDGKHLVTEPDGMNLIPLDFTDDFALLTFWRNGTKIRDITVRDIFPDHRGLLRTVSYYAWRQTMDFDPHGRLRVSLLDGKILLFDISTGTLIKS